MTINKRGKKRRGAIRSAQVVSGKGQFGAYLPTIGKKETERTQAPVVDVIDEYGQSWNGCKLMIPGGGRSGAYFPPGAALSKTATFDKSSGSEVILCFGDGLKPQPVVMGAFMHPKLSNRLFNKDATPIPDQDHSGLDGKINVDDTMIPGHGGGRIIWGGNIDARIEIDTRFTARYGKHKKKGRPIFLHVGGDITAVGHQSHVVITQSNVRAYDRLLLAHSTGILIEKMCAKIDQLEATVTALYNWAKHMKVQTNNLGQDNESFIQFSPGSPNVGDSGGWAPGALPSLHIPEFNASSWCRPHLTTEGKRVVTLKGKLPTPDLEGQGSDSGTTSQTFTKKYNKEFQTHTGYSAQPLKQFPTMTMRDHDRDDDGLPKSTITDAHWMDRMKTTGGGQYLRFWTSIKGKHSQQKGQEFYEMAKGSTKEKYELHRELSRLCIASPIRISAQSLWSESNRSASGIPFKHPQVFVDHPNVKVSKGGGKYWTEIRYRTGGN